MNFKTLSITARSGFKYRPAPADFLLFSLGNFGSESRMMYELSKALIVIGGGGQAYNEATEYLLYNPQGLLVLIDDPTVGGSSKSLLSDQRFANLARQHTNIIVARTGSEAGIKLAERLNLTKSAAAQEIIGRGFNVLRPQIDYHSLLPNSHIVGFSGWSNFANSGPDLQNSADRISRDAQMALQRVHKVLSGQPRSVIYATSGNDPKFKTATVPAFESMVHNLSESANVKYLALTANVAKPAELNPRIKNLSFISPTWEDRTQQFVAHIDVLVSAGGNKTVVDQAIHLSHTGRRHLHILGANTLTDMRIEKIKNPNLRVMHPADIQTATDDELLKILGLDSTAR